MPTRPLCRGLLLAFEGLDGAGKTTQVGRLWARLQREGYTVLRLKEPTDGIWGQKIRRLAQEGRHTVSPATELEWFLHDRRDDVEHNIQPALARKQIVILDRYYFSTMAYQGALGFDPHAVRQQNEAFAPAPDLLLLLDITPAAGMQRVAQRGAVSHFERLDYLERVARIFETFDTTQFPYLQRVPTHRPVEVVQEDIWQRVQPLLEAAACLDVSGMDQERAE